MAANTLVRQARRRVAAKTGFYIHATIFTVVNAGLIALNLMKPGFPWSAFPFLGWGLGLAFHAISVFGFPGTSGMRQRMIAGEIDKLQATAATHTS
ncbi:MAG: 2TM domain-containing protein [Planctomycetota bacterium]|nr:2TM domain-containing protein [Planctomycetota bacterium]RLS39817.1 MAG: hypothetical protein DWH82_04655 [Planctomycetota bacterium]